MSSLDLIIPKEDRYGDNVVRTNRLISWILYKWTKTSAIDGEHRSHLKAIYFDKLGEFTCRIIDTLHENKIIRYPSAYESRPGIHGPGRAIRIDRLQEEEDSCGRDPEDFRQHKYAYIGEIAEKLPLMTNDTRALFRIFENKKPWSDQCEFSSEINDAVWEVWMKEKYLVRDDKDSIFLEPHEIDLVNRLADAISKLSHKEIRSLGTHHSVDATLRAIEFNRSKWFKNSALICQSSSSETMSSIARRLIILADEICRKSQKNRDHYFSGWNKMTTCFSSGQLFDAFRKTQHEAGSIWNDSIIMEYSRHSKIFLDLSTYINGFCEVVHGAEANISQVVKEANSVVPSLNSFLEKAERLQLPILDSKLRKECAEFIKIFKDVCIYFNCALPCYKCYKPVL